MRLLADLFLLVGAAFTLLGALGLVRMPDVYNRIQAGTKAVTLGALSLILGIGLLYPQWWSKLLVISLLILVTNPLGSSTIARALLMAGVAPWKKAEAKTPQESET
ncbi:MAG: monovalent cation/H(+) antiporter subunit G [Candidatus Thiodiazotropha sp. (ex Monitilora ramsayi)]|nr:monovalent cation/H(+) antiporter subunit G [Candidatus Thiodiazotropha sp. (ex Monitilora ramsayi)]